MKPRKLNKIEIIGDDALIHIDSKLYGHVIVYIDAVDVDRVKEYTWCVHGDPITKTPHYCGTNLPFEKMIKNKKRIYHFPLYLHRFIARSKPGIPTDHKDGNGLNNRSSNLRNWDNDKEISWCANSQNRSGATKKSKTQIRGIARKGNRWYVSAIANKKRSPCKSFKILEAALLWLEKWRIENMVGYVPLTDEQFERTLVRGEEIIQQEILMKEKSKKTKSKNT